MTKTAKQFVYDAITHMRSKIEGIELTPIELTDKLVDYGFKHDDICKLAQYLYIDMEVEFGHSLMHEENVTVERVITMVQEVMDKIVKEEVSYKIEDYIENLEKFVSSFKGLNYSLPYMLAALDVIVNREIANTLLEAYKTYLETSAGVKQNPNHKIISEKDIRAVSIEDFALIQERNKYYTKELEEFLKKIMDM